MFERLNSGGEELTDQEARNAIYDGPMNRLCLRLSLNPSLCRLWDIPIPSEEEMKSVVPPSPERLENEDYKRMADVELVLRFFAYRQKHDKHRGTDLGTYLDTYLKRGNGFPVNVLTRLEQLFADTIETVESVFGEKAFWLFRKRKNNWAWRETPTTTVYDPLMLAVSERLGSAQKLIDRRDKIREAIPGFYQQNYEHFEGRNVNRTALMTRDKKFADLLDEMLA